MSYSADELSMYGVKKRRKKLGMVVPVSVMSGIAGLCLGIGFSFMVNNDFKKIKDKVTIETGTFVNRAAFFDGELNKAKLLTDLTQIDTNVPGTYQIGISLYGKRVNSVLEVVDSTPPIGTAVPQTVLAGHLPDVNLTVSNLYDLSGKVYAAYSGTPDISKAGDTTVPVVITDAYGNTNIINVPFNVFADTTAPEIKGAKDITVVAKDPLTLLKNITVSDDYTENPKLEADASNLDSETPGKYEITYLATDDSGNQSSVTVTVTVTARPSNYVYPEEVYKLAQPVYDKIIERDDLTDVEKAMRICKWANESITYTDSSDKSHWTGAAVAGFNTLRGDCYTYYACVKALLDMAGIDNRYAYGTNKKWMHAWNVVFLDGEWYNCDAARTRKHQTWWFMRTDAEMDQRYMPIREPGVPDRATKSVQDRLDFTNLTIN